MVRRKRKLSQEEREDFTARKVSILRRELTLLRYKPLIWEVLLFCFCLLSSVVNCILCSNPLVVHNKPSKFLTAILLQHKSKLSKQTLLHLPSTLCLIFTGWFACTTASSSCLRTGQRKLLCQQQKELTSILNCSSPVTEKKKVWNTNKQKQSKTNSYLRKCRAFNIFNSLQVPGQFFSRLWSYGLLLVLGKFLNCWGIIS